MINVLIVDDSSLVRTVLQRQLSAAPDIVVKATAPDPYVARLKIMEHKPDVMTLDLEMPRLDGLSFLRTVMKHMPIPTIVVSSLTPQGSEMAMEALASGAYEVISKPGTAYSVDQLGPRLIQSVRHASLLTKSALQKLQQQSLTNTKSSSLVSFTTTRGVIAIGASTGGTVALEKVLMSLPASTPPIVIVQHMPPEFTRSFAERLDRNCQITVREARQGDQLKAGVALIAPGGYHMVVKRQGALLSAHLTQSMPVHHQRPSVDVLFHSMSSAAGKNAVGVILTGMGADGAEGLLAMKQAGAYTIAQDKKTSVVWGMPAEAVKIGAATKVAPLLSIATAMMQASQRNQPTN